MCSGGEAVNRGNNEPNEPTNPTPQNNHKPKSSACVVCAEPNRVKPNVNQTSSVVRVVRGVWQCVGTTAGKGKVCVCVAGSGGGGRVVERTAVVGVVVEGRIHAGTINQPTNLKNHKPSNRTVGK